MQDNPRKRDFIREGSKIFKIYDHNASASKLLNYLLRHLGEVNVRSNKINRVLEEGYMTMLLTESHGEDDLRHKSLILFPSEATKPYWCIRLMFFIQILKNPK